MNMLCAKRCELGEWEVTNAVRRIVGAGETVSRNRHARVGGWLPPSPQGGLSPLSYPPKTSDHNVSV